MCIFDNTHDNEMKKRTVFSTNGAGKPVNFYTKNNNNKL